MSKMKKLIVMLLVLAVAILLPLTVSADEVADGWKLNADGSYSYVIDGEVVKGELFYDMYDAQNSTNKWYYADANGIMVANVWVQPYLFNLNSSDDYRTAWYRFGADGAAVTGECEGYYHNIQGCMLTGKAYQNDKGEWFVTDSNGASVALTNNAWSLVEGKWYFVDDGNLCAGGIYEISDIDFYFNYDGTLADEAMFCDVWTEEDGDIEVFVKADGTVQYEGWVEFDGEFYYLLNGARQYGVLELPHATFLLNEWGALVVDKEYDGFRTNANGEILMDAWYWNADAEAWQYYNEYGYVVYDGEREIAGDLYYFVDGYAQANVLIEHYDEETGEYVWYWFNSACKGAKAADGWYPLGENEWTYLLNGEKLEQGINNIGGTNYYFNYNGDLAVEDVVWVGDTAGYEDGYYATDINGCIDTTFGWRVIDGEYIFVKDTGKVHVNGWIFYNNNWYYMYSGGYMAHGTTIQIYGRTYYFDADGTTSDVTVDGWYMTSAYNVKFFNYAINIDNGWQNIGGYWYYFNSGYAYANDIYEIDDEYYAFDQMGRMLTCGFFDMYGWTYYATSTGKLAVDCIQNVGSYYYLFNERGMLYTTQVVAFDANENGLDEYYLADDAGRIIQIDGADGWYEFDGWYYVEDLRIYRGGRYYVELSENYYTFDDNGRMVADEIYDGIYYDVNGTAVSGWINYNGAWLYGDEDNGKYPYLYENGCYFIDGKYYVFDGYELNIGTFSYVRPWNNSIFDAVTTDMNGAIMEVSDYNDGYFYDYNNGYGDVYLMEDGETYTGWYGNRYFTSYGLAVDTVVWDDDADVCYYVDYKGNCVYGQWINRYDNWMLAKADGSLYFNEWYTDGTNWYYFRGYTLVTDEIYYINGVDQMFDANGLWLGEFTTDKVVDGWNVINGKYYYGYAGYVYSYGIYSIGGEWYAFNDNGMVTNEWYNGRYFGADGKMVKYAAGWNLINGKWAYFDNKHQIMSGWVYEGTAAYYIKSVYDETPYSDEELLGYEMVTGYYAVNGDLYYFGSNGVCQGAVVEDGWYAYGADWYYVADGEAAYGEYEINGTTYVFEAGKMVANDISFGRYLDANGNVVSAEGWYVFNGHWIYITADGYVARGLHLIGATEYYFDYYGFWVA